MSMNEEILNELKKLNRLIILSNGKNIENELEKHATNNDRKKMWVLIDGKNQADDIVRISGLKKSAVYNFLKQLEGADFIERAHGYPPTRKIDYVPAAWIELLPQESISEQNESEGVTPVQESKKEEEAQSDAG